MWHRFHKWTASLDDGVLYRIPADIKDEIVIAGLFLALAGVNVRGDAGTVLRATDATPHGHGAVEATCPPHVLR